MAVMRKRGVSRRTHGMWNFIQERERKLIEQWREKRLHEPFKQYDEFWSLSFTLETVKSFAQSINIMVLIHVAISVFAVFLFKKFDVSYDINVALFISPIVFPLAFSINSDFQRREKVLEDLAAFKSAGMTWYFCMRDWRQPAGLDADWINAVRNKLVSLLLLLCEYLLTSKVERRAVILRAIYEDFSGANQLTEKLRASKLPSNSAIVSRSVHFIHVMCLSFERLRVIRDYRSPRSIQSFNKVFIVLLIIILAPYFVHLGLKSDDSPWQPYYFAVILAFVFSTLQGVQDRLFDPFDGMGEDDINVNTIDEWAPVLESINRSNPLINMHKAKSSTYFEANVDGPLQECYNDDVESSLNDNCVNDGGENMDQSVDAVAQDNEINVFSEYSVYSSTEVIIDKDQLDCPHPFNSKVDNCDVEKVYTKYSSPAASSYRCHGNNDNDDAIIGVNCNEYMRVS